MKKITICAFILSLLVSLPVHSRADDDLKMCAALMPCDLDGNVLPEFANGECADVYKEQCSQIRAESLHNDRFEQRYNRCLSTKRSLKRVVTLRDRKIAALRGMVNQLKNQLAVSR